MKFSDIKSGLFRSKNGVVYTKLAEAVVTKTEEMNTINAVQITSGAGQLFADDEEIFEW